MKNTNIFSRCITIPYWDWTQDIKDDLNDINNIQPVKDFGGVTSETGCINIFGDLSYVDSPGNPPSCINRPFRDPQGWRPPGPLEVANEILSNKLFTNFSIALKAHHALIHNRIVRKKFFFYLNP